MVAPACGAAWVKLGTVQEHVDRQAQNGHGWPLISLLRMK